MWLESSPVKRAGTKKASHGTGFLEIGAQERAVPRAFEAPLRARVRGGVLSAVGSPLLLNEQAQKKPVTGLAFWKLVPRRGLEPPRPCEH